MRRPVVLGCVSKQCIKTLTRVLFTRMGFETRMRRFCNLMENT